MCIVFALIRPISAGIITDGKFRETTTDTSI